MARKLAIKYFYPLILLFDGPLSSLFLFPSISLFIEKEWGARI
jgi:hypothetical protein